MKLLSVPLLASSIFVALASEAATAQDRNPRHSRRPIPYQVQKPPLDTPWTYTVGTDPWPHHPRPQLRRSAWQWETLNGVWTYQAASPADDSALANPPTGDLEREVLVPSCIESGLSGIQTRNVTHMWFARRFAVPRRWEGGSVVVHFEAVDYEATVLVNGERAGGHVGGYDRFTVDVTRLVRFGEENDL